MTIEEAAEFLNVSIDYVRRLVGAGRIVAGSDGLNSEEVAAFKKLDDNDRRRIADELSAEARKLELDY